MRFTNRYSIKLAVNNAKPQKPIRFRNRYHGRTLFTLSRLDNTLSQHYIHILLDSGPYCRSGTIGLMRTRVRSRLNCDEVLRRVNLAYLTISHGAMFGDHLTYRFLEFGMQMVKLEGNQ